jgi:hypothetical protein
MEATGASETLAVMYQIVRGPFLEDQYIDSDLSENLRFTMHRWKGNIET